MSISTPDFSQLENIKFLSSFVDFVKNPDKYAKLIKEGQETIKEAKAVISAYTTVEEANIYLKNAHDFLAKESTALALKGEQHEKETTKATEEILKKSADLDKRETEARAIQDLIDKKRISLEKQEISLDKKLDELEKKKQTLLEKEAELNEKQTIMNVNLDKMKAMLG